MRLSVELSVQEDGLTTEKAGYLRDSDIELVDLLKWTKRQLIIIADQTLKEEQAKGFDKSPVVVIDGRRDKRPIDVNPLGQIEFFSRLSVSEILMESYRQLLSRSKVLTGQYKASHFVFLNGIQVATDMDSLAKWIASEPKVKDKDTIRIVNIQPYGRRLELLGVTAQRTNAKLEDAGRRSKKRTGTKVRLPNGAYQLTARAIRSKFKNNLGVRFTFLPGSSLGLSGAFKGGRKRNSAGRPYLYPSIVFTVSERGLTL